MFGQYPHYEVGQPPEAQYIADEGIHYQDVGQNDEEELGQPPIPWPAGTPEVITEQSPWVQFGILAGALWIGYYALLAGGVGLWGRRRRRRNPALPFGSVYGQAGAPAVSQSNRPKRRYRRKSKC